MSMSIVLKPQLREGELAMLESASYWEYLNVVFEDTLAIMEGADIPSDFDRKIMRLIHEINDGTVGKIEEGKEKIVVKKKIASACKLLMHHLRSKMSPEKYDRLINEVKKGIQLSSEIHDYDAEELLSLLRLNQSEMPVVNEKECPPLAYFIWNGNQSQLEKLAEILLDEYKLIKTRASFINLFNKDPKKRNFVKWDESEWGKLAILLYQLCKVGKTKSGQVFVKPSKGKGYLKLASGWFVNFSGEKVEKNLTEISGRMNKMREESRNQLIDIKSIMAQLLRLDD